LKKAIAEGFTIADKRERLPHKYNRKDDDRNDITACSQKVRTIDPDKMGVSLISSRTPSPPLHSCPARRHG